MKKLSEFQGQEHITSVLRASIIKNEPFNRIAILGDRDLAHDIAAAYKNSLTCKNPQRGDACGECVNCRGLNTLWACVEFFDEFTLDAVNFELKTSAGSYVNPELLTLLIYAYQADRAETIKVAKTVALGLTFTEYCQGLISILNNVLYLKNNLEVTELDKLEALRALSIRMSAFEVTAAIRLLWDAQDKSVLSDQLRIEVTSLLLSEVFQPTPSPDKLVVTGDQTPIKVVEQDILEQPLSLEKMLEIAHS